MLCTLSGEGIEVLRSALALQPLHFCSEATRKKFLELAPHIGGGSTQGGTAGGQARAGRLQIRCHAAEGIG